MCQPNCLVEIPIETFPTLRDLYKVQWPQHVLSFSLIENCIRRIKVFPEQKENFKFYSLNGDWKSDGTFIFMTETNMVVGTLDMSLGRLKTALKLIDYSKRKFFMCLRECYRPAVFAVVQEFDLEVIYDSSTKCLYMSKDDAKKLQINVPKDLELRPLTVDCAAQINESWPYRSEHSVDYISYLIKFNLNVGLFDESGELLAWCLRIDVGSLGALQVEENHYRKGFGTIVASAITRKIAEELNEDTTSNVIETNVRSLNMFYKIGYKQIDRSSWIAVKSK